MLALLIAAALVRALWPRFTRTTCARTKADIVAIECALIEHARRHGGHPAGLEALVQPDDRGYRLLDRTSVPTDPWGRAYRYEPPTRLDPRPLVYTLGADGAIGGSGADEDLDNRMIAAGAR